MYVEDVERGTYDAFCRKVSIVEERGEIPSVRESIGKGYSDYHYRMNIGAGGGAISIGYKHNAARERDDFFRMRVEFNPAKANVLHERFWDLFGAMFLGHKKVIKQLDVAFDVSGVHIHQIIAVSLTGRQKSLYKGTTYYGSRGNHGRLKIYDKKKELEEQQRKEVETDLTRIEYTVRFEEPVTIQILSKCLTCINTEYELACFSLDDLKGDVKAAVIAVHYGYMQMNEFSRTMIKKMKKAIESMGKLDLDHAYKASLPKNIKMISSYVSRYE